MACTKPLLTFSGLVLVAGKSSRMGRDKALIEVDGEPLWRRQVRLLEQAGAIRPIFISARREQTWVLPDFSRIDDAVPDAGPLGGIVSALSLCVCTHLLVLAVDLPRMNAIWFKTLLDECGENRGAIGQAVNGEFEPLAAIYPQSLHAFAAEQLRLGKRSLQHLAQHAVAEKSLRARLISAAQKEWFENWNTPTDLKAPSL